MQALTKPIPAEPTLIDCSTIGRRIYIPKQYNDDFPDRIGKVYDETDKLLLVKTQGNTEFIVSKTEILISWFPQEYYNWALGIFADYGYLLGWVILEKKYPSYRYFFRQVIKINNTEVYLIIKDK